MASSSSPTSRLLLSANSFLHSSPFLNNNNKRNNNNTTKFGVKNKIASKLMGGGKKCQQQKKQQQKKKNLLWLVFSLLTMVFAGSLLLYLLMLDQRVEWLEQKMREMGNNGTAKVEDKEKALPLTNANKNNNEEGGRFTAIVVQVQHHSSDDDNDDETAAAAAANNCSRCPETISLQLLLAVLQPPPSQPNSRQRARRSVDKPSSSDKISEHTGSMHIINKSYEAKHKHESKQPVPMKKIPLFGIIAIALGLLFFVGIAAYLLHYFFYVGRYRRRGDGTSLLHDDKTVWILEPLRTDAI